MKHILIRKQDLLWVSGFAEIQTVYDIINGFAFCKVKDKSFEEMKNKNLYFQEVCETGKSFETYKRENERGSWIELVFFKILLKIL